MCVRLHQDSSTSGSLHFGVDVSVLSSPAQPVPQVLEMLLVYVEMNGLDTEGIYRKSGSACRARELHQILETSETGPRSEFCSARRLEHRCARLGR